MSTIDEAIANIVQAYDMRIGGCTSRRNTLFAFSKRRAISTHGCEKVYDGLCKAYLERCVHYFALGDHRRGKHFYDGLFNFYDNDRQEVRELLLHAAATLAGKKCARGNHQAVHRLLNAVLTYLPDGVDEAQVGARFSEEGVDVSSLRPPNESEPLWRLRPVKATTHVIDRPAYLVA